MANEFKEIFSRYDTDMDLVHKTVEELILYNHNCSRILVGSSIIFVFK